MLLCVVCIVSYCIPFHMFYMLTYIKPMSVSNYFIIFARTYPHLWPSRIDIPVFRNHGKLTLILEHLTNLQTIIGGTKHITFWSTVKNITTCITLVDNVANRKNNNTKCIQKQTIMNTNYFTDSDFNKVTPQLDQLSQKLRCNIDSLILSMKFFVPEICSDKFTMGCYSLTLDTFKLPLSNQAILTKNWCVHQNFKL
jgi:hypothetical protein